MTTLDRHFAAQLARVFAATLLSLCLFYAVVDILTDRFEDIVAESMPWSTVALYYLLLMPAAITNYHFMGVAMLTAVLLVYGASARRNEIVPLFAAGIRTSRIARPAIVLAIAASALQLASMQWLAPAAYDDVRRYEAEYFSESARSHGGQRESVSWSNLQGQWTCQITKFNRTSLAGEDVFMIALRPGNEEQIRARRIYWEPGRDRWMLEDGSWAVFTPVPGVSGNSAMSERRITQEPAPLSETPEDLFEPFEDPGSFATTALPEVIRTAESRRVPVVELEVEFQARFAAALLPLVVLAVGIPLAIRTTRGGRSADVALALVIVLAYLFLFNSSRNIGNVGRIDPVAAAWLANGVCVAVGVVLSRRSPG